MMHQTAPTDTDIVAQNQPAATPDDNDTSDDDRTEPFSPTEIDARLKGLNDDDGIPYDVFKDTYIPLDKLQIDDELRSKGVRMLLRPIIRLRALDQLTLNARWEKLSLSSQEASSKQRKENVIAVAQGPEDIKFALRIPAITFESFTSLALLFDFYFNPSNDAIVFLNRSDVPVSVSSVPSIRETFKAEAITHVIDPALAKGLMLGTWRIIIKNVAIFDIRILEKPPALLYEGVQFSGDPANSVLFQQTKSPEGIETYSLNNHDPGETTKVPKSAQMDEYEITASKLIASTTQSAVYEASHSNLAASKSIAVKIIKTLTREKSDKPNVYERNIIRQADRWLREIQCLKGLHHDSVTKYLGGDARFLSIYMEYIDALDLTVRAQWRDKNTNLFLGTRQDALQVLRDISNAVSFLHRYSVHNDIKPSNILYSVERGAVLCDFGLCIPISSPSLSGGGTPYYIPPEFIVQKHRGPPADVWALGITMLYLVGRIPLPESRAARYHSEPLYWSISGVHKPQLPFNVHGNGQPAVVQMRTWLKCIFEVSNSLDKENLLEKIISKMLAEKPSKRSTIHEVLAQLSWLNNNTAAAAPTAAASTNDSFQATTLGFKHSSGDAPTAQTSLWSGQQVETKAAQVERSVSSDVESIYTSGVSNSPEYVNIFVNDLFNDSFLDLPNESVLQRICDQLPDLLRGFARRIGAEKSGAGQIMKFIHSKRHQITSTFKEYSSAQIETRRSPAIDIMTPTEKFELWKAYSNLENPNEYMDIDDTDDFIFENKNDDDEQRNIDDTHDDNDNNNEEDANTRLLAYKEAVVPSISFKWLVARIRREIAIDVTAAYGLNHISTQIRQLLYAEKVNRLVSSKNAPSSCSMLFQSDWDPLLFIREQDYRESTDKVVEGAVTITQDANGNAEALSCSEYLNKTWPLVGHQFMKLIKQVVKSEIGSQCSGIVFGNTTLTIWIETSGFVSLKVVGDPEVIIEIGEAFTWISTALRSAPTKTTAAFVEPILRIDDGNLNKRMPVVISSQSTTSYDDIPATRIKNFLESGSSSPRIVNITQSDAKKETIPSISNKANIRKTTATVKTISTKTSTTNNKTTIPKKSGLKKPQTVYDGEITNNPSRFFCRHCNHKSHTFEALQDHIKEKHITPFICVFHWAGCNSSFSSMGQWTRHVKGHLGYQYWICEEEDCAQDSSGRRSASLPPFGHIFKQSHLYTRHFQLVHFKSDELNAMKTMRQMRSQATRTRCEIPTFMTCPAVGCSIEFHGLTAWDDRMEHVARHLECASIGSEPPVSFGGLNDSTLTAWAERPGVDIVRRINNSWQIRDPLEEDFPFSDCMFSVHASYRKPHKEALPSIGQCWRDLFRNPAVVLGFPIQRRHPDLPPGLEIPLDILAALVETSRISVFNGKIFLKGFCTVLVPTKYVADTVYWHVIFNEDGGRISCSDPRVSEIANDFNLKDHLALADIENSRHIVGWCERVRNYAGSKEANYDIGRTDLDPPAQGFAFDRISISGGKYLSLNLSGVLGKKDRPLRRGRESGLYRQLQWIEQRFVVFYYTAESRAWLIDGLSALLHLVRASFLHRRNQQYPILFSDDDINEAEIPFTGKSAARSVLMSDHNLNLQVYKNPDKVTVKKIQKATGDVETITETEMTWTHFSDTVGDIYNILWNIFDHQMDESSADGVGTRVYASPRRRLEGFDFIDVASECDPIEPKVTHLQHMGAGWVDLIRATQAITLFGDGDGDLFQPSSSSSDAASIQMLPYITLSVDTSPSLSPSLRSSIINPPEFGLCGRWTQLPKGEDLLAISTTELGYILKHKLRATNDKQLWELTRGQYWCCPDKLFEKCECFLASSGPKCDRVQVLLPTKFPKLFTRGLRSPSIPLPDNGAAIFGHSITFPLRWSSKANSLPSEMSVNPIGLRPDDDNHNDGTSERRSLASRGSSTTQDPSSNGMSGVASTCSESLDSLSPSRDSRMSRMLNKIKYTLKP